MKQAIKVVSVAFGVLLAFAAEAQWTVTGTVYNGGTVTLSDGNWAFSGRTFTSTVYDTPTTGTYEFRPNKILATPETDEGKKIVDFTNVHADTDGKLRVSAFDATAIFKNNATLEQFIAPDMVSLLNEAFSKCTALTKVVLSPDVSYMAGNVFNACSALVSLSPTCFSKLTSLGGFAFNGCSALRCGLDFPEITDIQNSTFNGCGLTSLCAEKVVTISNSSGYPPFGGCKNLSGTLYFPELKSIGERAFYNASNSAATNFFTVCAPNLEEIKAHAFWQCYSLTNFVAGSSLKTIEGGAFKAATNLVSFSPFLPRKLETLGASAFFNCKHLRSDLKLMSQSITSIGQQTFSGCNELTDIVIKSPIASIASQGFGVGPNPKFYFYGNPPAMTPNENPINAQSGRITIYARGAKTSAEWQNAVAPYNDPEFINLRDKAIQSGTYPGEGTIGVLQVGYIRNWVTYPGYLAWVVDWPAPGLKILLK